MTHDNLLGRYRAYLTLERAMADNTLEAYCRETARLLARGLTLAFGTA